LLLGACATLPLTADDPGVEAGIAFDLNGERGGYVQGIADPATGQAATLDDPVRVASVSKLVVAIGAMKLAEQGHLSLNEDVSRYLGWTLRNPAFPYQPISLRSLLSHTAGVRDHNDQYAVPLGETVRGAMADPHSWDLAHGPTERHFTYANMNFPIIASVLERVTGERFDVLMRRLVLQPLKLDACFNWPGCSDRAVRQAVVLTQGGKPVRDDLGGRRPDCPVFRRDGTACDLAGWRPGANGALFAPQGGLRISVRGLARLGQLLLHGGELDGARILSPASVAELLRPQWRFTGNNGDTDSGFYCSYGLATHQIATGAPGCRDDAGGDHVPRVGHAGEAYGLRSGLWIDPVAGTGIAYFRTGLSDSTPRRRSAFRAAEERAFRRTAGLLRR
ncbi:MAG TPA: serine hydrolase, partial [Sphingomicrobium sp.]|nr:serine hydrolase [Sphingomicrobium sp.]